MTPSHIMRGHFSPISSCVTFQTLSKTVSILGICALQESSPTSCSKGDELTSQGLLDGTAPKAVSLQHRVPLHDICSLSILPCHSLRHKHGPDSGTLKVISGVIESEGQNADKVQMLTLLIMLMKFLGLVTILGLPQNPLWHLHPRGLN